MLVMEAGTGLGRVKMIFSIQGLPGRVNSPYLMDLFGNRGVLRMQLDFHFILGV